MADQLATWKPEHPQVRTGREGWDLRSDQRIAAQMTVLEGIAAGYSVEDACALAGRSYSAYSKWRQDPRFRVAVDEAKAARREPDKSPTSFRDFRKTYFGMDTYTHQALMVDALETVKPREIVMINIWPEAGKTTTVEDWICQQLALNPNLRITDVSESSGLCKKTVGRIKSRMTDSRNFGPYIAGYGPFYEDGQEREGKPWAKEYFTVAKADHDERDYSLEARAITSAAYGTRIDLLIVDDIQSRRNLAQTDTIYDHLRQTYFTRGRQMRTVIIGTRIGTGDIYERMLDDGIIDRNITIPAIEPDGTITCPELWGVDRMMFDTDEEWMFAVQARVDKQRLIVGERAWAASYMQQPSFDGLSTFSEEMIESVKDPLRRVAPPELGEYVALSLDPALGGGNALTACVHEVAKLKILDQKIDYQFARMEDILVGIEDFAQRYHPNVVIIERDAFQKALVNDTRLAAIARRYGFQIVPHTTASAKADPILGVASMASAFILGEVSIPWQDDFTRRRLDGLVTQLRAWRPDVPARLLKQDAVMSLWFNWRYWMENRIARSGDDEWRAGWNRTSLPYNPTPYAVMS